MHWALHKVIAACELVVLDTYLIKAVGLHVIIAMYTNHLLTNAHRLRSKHLTVLVSLKFFRKSPSLPYCAVQRASHTERPCLNCWRMVRHRSASRPCTKIGKSVAESVASTYIRHFLNYRMHGCSNLSISGNLVRNGNLIKKNGWQIGESKGFPDCLFTRVMT